MGNYQWKMGGESNSQKNAEDDVEGHGSLMRNEDDTEGHGLRNVDDDQVETGSEKPGDRARVKARVKNDDSDVEGHGTNLARNADDDVEGHATQR